MTQLKLHSQRRVLKKSKFDSFLIRYPRQIQPQLFLFQQYLLKQLLNFLNVHQALPGNSFFQNLNNHLLNKLPGLNAYL